MCTVTLETVHLDEKRGKSQITYTCDGAVVSYKDKVLLSSNPTRCPARRAAVASVTGSGPLSVEPVNVCVYSHRGF